MDYHLKTFSTWLREDMSLADDVEVIVDRAAITKGRKQRPTTRWDHLAKQQSFSMPKVPSRRRLGDTIDEETATECSPRMIKQTSFCLPRGGTRSRLGDDVDEGTADRPGMGAKQTSLSCLPRQTSFKNLTEDEQKEMPRLMKQSSFKSLQREVCESSQTTSSRPKHPSRPQRRCMPKDSPKPNRRPKLTVHKDDSNDNATTNTLSSMPRLVKQTSFTVARHSSRGPLIGSDENVANSSNRRHQMAKQNSLTMPREVLIGDDEQVANSSDRRKQMSKQISLSMLRRRSLTCDSKTGKLDEDNDPLSIMPRMVKQTSFTVTGHSSRGPLIDSDENVANGSDRRQQMAKQNGRRSLMCVRETGKMDEENDTLSSAPRLEIQTSLTGARLSSHDPLIGDDENVANGSNRRQQMAKQDSLTTMSRRPTRTFDSEDNPFETTNSLSSTRRLVEQAQHLYTKKAQVSDSEFRCGRSVARTKCPPSYAQYRDS
jgi:hypothetical protein